LKNFLTWETTSAERQRSDPTSTAPSSRDRERKSESQPISSTQSKITETNPWGDSSITVFATALETARMSAKDITSLLSVTRKGAWRRRWWSDMSLTWPETGCRRSPRALSRDRWLRRQRPCVTTPSEGEVITISDTTGPPTKTLSRRVSTCIASKSYAVTAATWKMWLKTKDELLRNRQFYIVSLESVPILRNLPQSSVVQKSVTTKHCRPDIDLYHPTKQSKGSFIPIDTRIAPIFIIFIDI